MLIFPLAFSLTHFGYTTWAKNYGKEYFKLYVTNCMYAKFHTNPISSIFVIE